MCGTSKSCGQCIHKITIDGGEACDRRDGTQDHVSKDEAAWNIGANAQARKCIVSKRTIQVCSKIVCIIAYSIREGTEYEKAVMRLVCELHEIIIAQQQNMRRANRRGP